MDHNGLIIRTNTPQPLNIGQGRGRGHGSEKHFDTAHKVEIVIHFLHGGFIRQTVEKTQRSKTGLDFIRGRDISRNIGGHFEFLFHKFSFLSCYWR